jgi:hypothetical protein
MNNFFEQRARLQYTAKVSDDLKLVTHFEFDNRFGAGRVAGSTTTNNSGDLDTDFTNFEMKWMYIDFNLGKNFNSKIGAQPYKDTIKGLFVDADMLAVMTNTKLGAYTLGVGFSRFDDDFGSNGAGNPTVTRLGDKDKDLFILDNTFAITKDTKVALSYYFLADYAAGSTGYPAANAPSNVLELSNPDQAILLHTFALSGESKVGPLTLSGFGAMQAGHQKKTGPGGSSMQAHGWAANAAAKMAAGPGTARAAFLFTSGDNTNGDDSHYKGWITSSVNSYNESGMQILARNTANSPSTTDTYIRRNVTNIALLTAGYDANLTDKLFLNGNVGFAWAPASNPGTSATPRNAGDFMGTEINLESGYKVYSNLTLKATAAYMMLGAYYKETGFRSDGTTPADQENPYSMRLHAQFKF